MNSDLTKLVVFERLTLTETVPPSGVPLDSQWLFSAFELPQHYGCLLACPSLSISSPEEGGRLQSNECEQERLSTTGPRQS